MWKLIRINGKFFATDVQFNYPYNKEVDDSNIYPIGSGPDFSNEIRELTEAVQENREITDNLIQSGNAAYTELQETDRWLYSFLSTTVNETDKPFFEDAGWIESKKYFYPTLIVHEWKQPQPYNWSQPVPGWKTNNFIGVHAYTIEGGVRRFMPFDIDMWPDGTFRINSSDKKAEGKTVYFRVTMKDETIMYRMSRKLPD